MLTWLRRFTVLLALAFWQGGLMFYGAVVVPIGRDVFSTDFSVVTSRVTVVLNVVSLVALLPLAWDLWAGPDHSAWRKRVRGLMWTVALATVLVLFRLHHDLDDRMSLVAGAKLADDLDFRFSHRAYLLITTLQWLAVMVYAALTLPAWRHQDRAGPNAT